MRNEASVCQAFAIPASPIGALHPEGTGKKQNSPIGITTINHPQEKLGEMAAELILEKIRKIPEEESSVKRLICPELIVRASTASRK